MVVGLIYPWIYSCQPGVIVVKKLAVYQLTFPLSKFESYKNRK